jgi:molybdopterin-containing oxidoreductase family iron-sulfur binding subunit
MKRPVGRRGFFRLLGIATSAVATACRRRTRSELDAPARRQDEVVTPGAAAFYATTCGACAGACGLQVKTYDGRAIKIEGNDSHPVTQGGVCAAGQAAARSLYDASRARGPLVRGAATTWQRLDADVVAALRAAAATGKKIRVVAHPADGPTLDRAMVRLLEAFPGAARVRYEPPYAEALRRACDVSYGVAVLPRYRLDTARVVLGVDADFLGGWLSPVALTRQYVAGRELSEGRSFSRHFQLESRLSLTGAKADERWAIAPSEVVPVLASLARRVISATGRQDLARVAEVLARSRAPELPASALDVIAEDLLRSRSGAVVLCGSDLLAAQLATVVINDCLGARGRTFALQPEPSPGGWMELAAFTDELRRGEVGVAVLLGVNPVYDHPDGVALQQLLGECGLVVSTSDRSDETAASTYLAPDHHFLEAWGDTWPRGWAAGLRQPVVAPLHDTRSACESLVAWAGSPRNHQQLLRARWEAELFPQRLKSFLTKDFTTFWDNALRSGYALVEPTPDAAGALRVGALATALEASLASTPAPAAIELVLYERTGLRDGADGNNPWLHELPDPVTKVSWDSVASVSIELARRMGLEEGGGVRLTVGARSVELPGSPEPGLHERVVAVPVGYGRTRVGPHGDGVGVNVYPLAWDPAVGRTLTPGGVGLEALKRALPIARSQVHSSMEGRDVIRETSLAEWRTAMAAREARRSAAPRPAPPFRAAPTEHRWALVIDLSACTGCGACVVACNAENNIPVVGASEMRARRDMHWLRMDRYYEGTPDRLRVLHQPVMCQHCENAPCEVVCPVLATVHSSDGLNEQVYSRCVGTRFCANNCPARARRFNWLDHPQPDALARMALNPDVVVRSRGVMEKCTFCVQRIHEGIGRARAEARPLRDGDVKTACQQSCPARAIVFGDVNDPDSRVAHLADDPRSYRLFEDRGIAPAVHYLARVRNPARSVT